MEFLISFYDNTLIYYPNIFFVGSFFISILGVILVSIGIIVFGKKIRRSFFERKKISFVYIIRLLITPLIYMIGFTINRINLALGYIESQTERIIKKIGKEILIKK